jgi:hypothetical protein
MKTIDRATMKQYWQDERLSRWLIWTGPVLFVGSLPLFYCAYHYDNRSFVIAGIVVILLGLSPLLYVGECENPKKCIDLLYRRDTWQYRLLDRWIKYSGQPLSMFPTSTIGSEYLRRWAIKELTERTWELNYRYSREQDFYDEEKKIDWKSLDPRKGEKIHKKRVERERWMKAQG